MRVLFFANTSWYLWNFRKNLIKAFSARGFDVFTLAPKDEYSPKLQSISNYVELKGYNNLSRNPVRESRALLLLLNIYRKLRPDLALHFTTKPVIYGSIVSSLLSVKYVNTVTGLGTLFVSSRSKGPSVKNGTGRISLSGRLALNLHRSIARKAFFTYFQNPDDASLILGLSEEEKSILFKTYPGVPEEIRARYLNGRWDIVQGSGVSLDEFSPKACKGIPRDYDFVYTGRLLREKGLTELAKASLLLSRNHNFKVLIVGIPYPGNPSYISKEELISLFPRGTLKIVNPTDDVVNYLCRSRFFVLPTYGEGLPKSLLEAMAVGLPGLASDVSGCNLLVIDGVTGFRFPPRDPEALCEAMRKSLTLDEASYARMSAEAVKRASIFSAEAVTKKYLSVIEFF